MQFQYITLPPPPNFPAHFNFTMERGGGGIELTEKRKSEKLTLEEAEGEKLELGDELTVTMSLVVRHIVGVASGSFFSPRTSRAGGDETLRSSSLLSIVTVSKER